jgi:adenosylhomocysteinase
MKYDVRDLGLAAQGLSHISWSDTQMPVLRAVRERFSRERPLEGIRVSACLHVTTETANLCRAFIAGGAEVALCASNPLSTQDDVAAALVKEFGVSVFARRGVDPKDYYRHIHLALDHSPVVTLDDGADLISTMHKERTELIPQILASLEETTTGLNRLRAMQREGSLRIPVIAVNDALTKYLFDNRYGTGQSTVDGIIRATNILLAGKTVVIAGYGWCGRGVASRMRAMGAKVIITEVSPIKALEAAMDGYTVMPISEAARFGDLFVTLTGNKHVIGKEHFELMKDGAIAANSGHFDIELDLVGLHQISAEVRQDVRPGVDQYILRENGHSIFVLGQGRLVNLACAEGHPAAVMDMSFSTQALMVEHVIKRSSRLTPKVHPVDPGVEDWIARIKLESMGIQIDTLTLEQERYLKAWEEGT